MAAYWGIPSRWWLRISRYNGTTVSRSHPGSWCVVCRANPGSNCLLSILHVRFFLVVLYKSCKCATARCAKMCQKNSTRPIQQSLSHRCLLQFLSSLQRLKCWSRTEPLLRPMIAQRAYNDEMRREKEQSLQVLYRHLARRLFCGEMPG